MEMNRKWKRQINETNDFVQMSADLKKLLIRGLPRNMKLVKFSKGHFYVSGFVKNTDTNNYVYFNTVDTRFDDMWYNNMLVRRAESANDYTGGCNNFCEIDNLIEMISRLAK